MSTRARDAEGKRDTAEPVAGPHGKALLAEHAVMGCWQLHVTGHCQPTEASDGAWRGGRVTTSSSARREMQLTAAHQGDLWGRPTEARTSAWRGEQGHDIIGSRAASQQRDTERRQCTSKAIEHGGPARTQGIRQRAPVGSGPHRASVEAQFAMGGGSCITKSYTGWSGHGTEASQRARAGERVHRRRHCKEVGSRKRPARSQRTARACGAGPQEKQHCHGSAANMNERSGGSAAKPRAGTGPAQRQTANEKAKS